MKTVVLSDISRCAGGLFYSVRALSKGLQKCGEEIEVFSPVTAFSKEDLPVWEPLQVSLYKGYGPLLFSTRLRPMLKGARPDLVHLHGIWRDEQWAALYAQEHLGAKVIISPRGMLDPWAVKNSAWKKKLVSWLFAGRSLNNATVMHALCESEYQSMRSYGLKNPIAVIPNGFDAAVKASGDSASRTGRRKLLFLGRLHPKKGLPQLLEAWHGLPAELRKEWQLVVAGWDQGGHEQELKQQCAACGMRFAEGECDATQFPEDADVFFAGSRYGRSKEMLLGSVDGFILPSFSEGLPMAVLEAWAYSLPVVMTPECNIPEGFAAGAAIRVAPEAASIRSGLEAFFRMDEAERRRIGECGRRLLLERFTWDTIAQEMQKVYHWCTEGGPAPDCIRME